MVTFGIPQKTTLLWIFQFCHIHIGDIQEEMVKSYDICFEVRKSARVWFSFSLLWKCETPPAGANCMLLEVLSSPSSWVTSAPSKAAGMMEACCFTWQHKHLLKQAWVKDSLLQDAAPMLTRVWAKHSSTTGSSVQTHSCYFKSSILRNWFNAGRIPTGRTDSIFMQK